MNKKDFKHWMMGYFLQEEIGELHPSQIKEAVKKATDIIEIIFMKGFVYPFLL